MSNNKVLGSGPVCAEGGRGRRSEGQEEGGAGEGLCTSYKHMLYEAWYTVSKTAQFASTQQVVTMVTVR